MASAADIAILVSARKIANRERLFFAVAQRLAARGCRVTFLAAGPEAELIAATPKAFDIADISPLPLALFGARVPHGLRIGAAVPRLAAYLQRAKPDVLLATSVPPNIVAALACSLAGFGGRLVLRQSNAVRMREASSLARVEDRWRDRLIPRLYRRADVIIANSEGVAANLVALGIDAARIAAIPNGVDCGGIEAALRTTSPADLPENRDGPLIVTAGRLVRQKDHATLIRAFAKLQRHIPSRLIILGEGPERRSLEKLAGKLAIGDRVAFPGYRENPYPYFAHAQLFALSSSYEGMPNVLLEALACGLPIVSTDCAHGPREILDSGRYGRLVPVGDDARLAQAMAASLLSPPAAEQQRRRARDFDADIIAERYVDVLLKGPDNSAAVVRRAAE